MEIIQKYENFDFENPNNSKSKSKEFHLHIKIWIILILIIIFQLIYIICINSVIKEKNNVLLDINFKKYLLDEGNKKLYEELNEDILTKYSYDDELKNKDKELKLKEDEIKDYQEKSSYLLNNFSPTIETIVKINQENEKKKFKIKELKSILINSNKTLNSTIIDSNDEINSIESLINENNIKNYKLCYKGQNDKINFSLVYEKCDFNKNISLLIIFQTEIYERFGIFISDKKQMQNIKTFVFSFNFGKKEENKIVEINDNQKKSFIYIINLIKDLKFNSENKGKDKDRNYIQDLNVTDLEIFHI